MSAEEDIQKSHSILASLVPTAESDRVIQLLVCLINARKEYDPAATDHGRSSIYQMLLGLMEYVSRAVPARPDLVHPLRDLLYSLKSLDAGSIAPLLMPVELRNRSPSLIPTELFRADAAALMEFKQRQGVKREIAAGQVARDLNKMGYRDDDGNHWDWKSVALWRDKVKRPEEAACPYASRYKTVLKELTAKFPKDPETAYRYFLDIMRDLNTPSILGNPAA